MVFPVTPHSQCINLVSNEKTFGHNHIWYHFFCQGMSVFFPDISGNPCMASFSELEYLLTGMMENPPDKKGFIKGLGISVPCYRRDDIKVIFGQSMKVSMEISQQTVIQINTSMCLVKFNCKKFFFSWSVYLYRFYLIGHKFWKIMSMENHLFHLHRHYTL